MRTWFLRSSSHTLMLALVGLSLGACSKHAAPPEPTSAKAPAPTKAPEQATPDESTPESAPSEAAEGLPDGDPALARKLVRDEGALLLDVRTAEEFSGGHVEGAKNITHTEVAERVDEIVELQGGDKSKPIVVYCQAGRRAGLAKEALLEAGFTQVSNLGGMSAWCEDC